MAASKRHLYVRRMRERRVRRLQRSCWRRFLLARCLPYREETLCLHDSTLDPAFIRDKHDGPPDDATVRTYRDQLVDRNKRCSRTGDVDGAVSGDHGRSVDHWPQIDSPEDCWFVTARPESKRRSAGIPPIL